jgi:iron(III) transport system substrate-binding protein
LEVPLSTSPVRRAARPLATALLAATAAFGSTLTAHAQDAEGLLTIYSGRADTLVAPILERFTEATGVSVEVRYADSAELAALLLEEGDRSPADVFFAQDAGALGAVSDAGLLAALAPEVLDRVEPRFRAADGTWVGVSGRARTAAYTTQDPELVMPDSILAFTDPEWSGRIGWVPANASFQSFVTALRVTEGEDAARAWLEGIIANQPVEYDGNAAAVEGVAAGEVDVAFVNHYYLMRLLTEFGEDYPVANHFFPAGDLGSLVNVAGVGQLASSDQPVAAAALVDFLLGEEAQTYFSESTYEYPLIAGVAADPRLPAMGSHVSPDIDLGDLADLQGTVALLREVGAIE